MKLLAFLLAVIAQHTTAIHMKRNLHFDALEPLDPTALKLPFTTPHNTSFLYTADALTRPLPIPSHYSLLNCNNAYPNGGVLPHACYTKPLALLAPPANPAILHLGPDLHHLRTLGNRGIHTVFQLHGFRLTVLKHGYPALGKLNLRVTGYGEHGEQVGRWESGHNGGSVGRWVLITEPLGDERFTGCAALQLEVWSPGDPRAEYAIVLDDLFIAEDAPEVVVPRTIDPGTPSPEEPVNFREIRQGEVPADYTYASRFSFGTPEQPFFRTANETLRLAPVGADPHVLRAHGFLFDPVSVILRVPPADRPQGASPGDVDFRADGFGVCGERVPVVEGQLAAWTVEVLLAGRMLAELAMGLWCGGERVAFELGEVRVRRWAGERPGCMRGNTECVEFGVRPLGGLKEYPAVPR